MDGNRKVIMAVGAHTGDAQLTMGMLLAKHAQMGDKVVIVDLTAGERGCPKDKTVEEFRAYNVDCARQFAEELGGESIVFDIPDGELYQSKEVEIHLARLMREKKVDAVLYHWKNSIHKDHIQAHMITENAVFFASLPTFELDGLAPAPIRKFMCAENWEDTEGFEPYFYFDVTDAYPLWERAVKKLWLTEHSTSMKYLRYYDALSVTRGALIQKGRATCFTTTSPKKVILESL